ncbi:MAG: hypothetical protein J0I16_08130 [Rhizobiales bacterium]|nr:hypothetical protein [Hyphomicrobiales bacterium]
MKLGLRYDRTDPWRSVAELWDQVVSDPIHSPFCTCLSPGDIAPDAVIIEQGLIGYLTQKYQSEGSQISLILADRLEASDGDFVGWLRKIGNRLSEDERQRLMEDVRESLLSMRNESSTSRFACA